jgi:hypothetical protein
MILRTLCTAFLFIALFGCNDPDEALLGYLDERAEQHLRSVCPGEFKELHIDKRRFGVECWWIPTSGERSRRVFFSLDAAQRIIQIQLDGLDRPDVVQMFDLFVSPILPPAAREELRLSTVDPEHAVTLRTKDAHVFKFDYGRRISFYFARDR